MLIPVYAIISDVLVPMLDVPDLGRLCRVNRGMAASVNDKNRTVREVLDKYRRLVILSDNTVRVHNKSGKIVIELILQKGDDIKTVLRMRYNGRMYIGWADPDTEKINGKTDSLIRHVFHEKSTILFNAKAVFIEEFQVSYQDIVSFDLYFESDVENCRAIGLMIESEVEPCWTFGLNFRLDEPAQN
jgi:hypothetical protein